MRGLTTKIKIRRHMLVTNNVTDCSVTSVSSSASILFTLFPPLTILIADNKSKYDHSNENQNDTTYSQQNQRQCQRGGPVRTGVSVAGAAVERRSRDRRWSGSGLRMTRLKRERSWEQMSGWLYSRLARKQSRGCAPIACPQAFSSPSTSKPYVCKGPSSIVIPSRSESSRFRHLFLPISLYQELCDAIRLAVGEICLIRNF